MNIIMLGAPGSGKGTVANIITKNYNIPAISTGDIIRENIKNKTELGLISENLINNGKLVPDDLVINLVKERLKEDDTKNGYILDGFPRTVAQAEALKQFQNIDYVFYLDVEYDVIEERILGRRVCPNCKAVYNVTNYNSNLCEKCGTEIITRADDNKETVKKRFDVYTEQTQPLVDFYKNEDLLYMIDGNSGSDNVFKEIDLIIKKEGN